MQARCHTLKSEFVPDVTSLFHQKLKMDLTIDDWLIGTGNESEDGYKSRRKACSRLLVENLQPPVLKAQISRLIYLERRDCKSDDVALFDLILEHAKLQQRFHRMSQDYAARGDSRLAKSERKPQRADSIKGGPSRSDAPTAPTTSAPALASQPMRAQPPVRPPPHEGCLVCKGPHWLKDFPTATGAQREEAQSKFREVKEQRLSAIRSKSARYATPVGTVRVNKLLEVPYMPDTGADKSIVPQNIMDSLLAVQPTGYPTKYAGGGGNGDGRKVLCDKEILLNLALSTVAGIVSMRSMPCLIFLLGCDALKELGIDAERQLAQLADQTTLATDVDEFPVSDALPDVQDVRTVDDDAKQLVAQAVANGMSGAPLLVLTRLPPRRYVPLQYVGMLVANDLVEQNNASRWESAVVLVSKPGLRDQFNLTID
ncbi:LOW QUALITY PROTEIN: hypothetical protein PHMEG_00035341 [Phytophthora megakarya]|uniref:Peptidase A2 domain-containing protein n=1 Tax=Phytophthora megakarya TaxID=4795 RepID=A0A225UPG5_9STRA|nr:LOW QUALITY PROTEIN: hypothetical protein PHMEG_00035341 [Phytophthora megakarya]